MMDVMHQAASFHKKNEFASIYSIQSYIYTRHVFSHICHFRPMTQPNPLKTKILDPFPTQPNPTRGSTQPMDNSGVYRRRHQASVTE